MFDSIVGIEMGNGQQYVIGEQKVESIILKEVNGEMAPVPWFEVGTSVGKIMVNGKFVAQVFTQAMPVEYSLWVDGGVPGEKA